MSPHRSYEQLNAEFQVRHISIDLGFAGMPDKEVYQFACRQERILVTFNFRDFRPLLTDFGSTVIGVSQNMPEDQVDKKVTKLLRQMTPSQSKGKYFSITNETQ